MVDLTAFNTLRVEADACSLVEINFPSDISNLKRLDSALLFLGHGANILFVNNFPGTIAKVNLAGIRVISQTEDSVTIEVAAGENWHNLVMRTAKQGWSGMENMALIPGTVGAAVVGNIAAYGQNQEDILLRVRATGISSGKKVEFTKSDCQFGYRESTFKHSLKDYLITSVTYRLSKVPHLDTAYHSRFESLAAELPSNQPLTPKIVAEAVVRLRSKKLPDLARVGTAGSFFKNPVVPQAKYKSLAAKISDLQWYPKELLSYHNEGPLPKVVKVPAGRLLDELGWKGKRVGQVGTHPTHALTIVNYGGASGREIYDFAESMRADIKQNFDIDLEYEVQIIKSPS